MFSSIVRRSIVAAALIFATLPMQAAPRQVLMNHVPRAVGESRPLGSLADSSQLNLAIGLKSRDQEGLDLFTQQVSDPQSPIFRNYLSAAEFTDRFAATQEDYDKLIRFVESNGMSVVLTHSNRMLLDITGPVHAINKAFHVNMTVWDHQIRGRFFAPDRNPFLDVDVDVLDVSGLDNFALPKPMDVKLTPLTVATPFVSGSGPSGLFIGKDFRAAYAPGVSLTGSGQTIGLVEFDGFYAADVTANFRQAGLTAVPVQTVLLDGFNGSPGSSNIEVILDIMMAGYMAPGASVIVYEGNYPNDVLNRMATDNLARQISCSWGFPINATTEQIFKQMIAQGQSFFTASGDSGAYSNGIMSPADDPNVTVVGGTALSTTGPGGTWLSESAWNGSGGGVSTTYPIPSYQQSAVMVRQGGSGTMRNIPDVALTAAVQMFVIYNNGQGTAVGGTSAAAPLWGGFAALANQQAAANAKPALGFVNPAIYALGAGSNYAAAMHDVTSGSNGFSAIAGFDLATGWGSPVGQVLINTLSAMTGASFTLSASSGTATVQAGSSTTSTVQITGQNGFSGTVVLSASGLPSGVTASFSAVSGGASTLTLSATALASAGTYPISVQGVSGSLTASAPLSLVVTAAPGFTLKTSAASLTLAQSTTGTAMISVSAASGFTGSVNLTVAGLPNGVTASFSPASTTASSTLSLIASTGATVGTSTITVTGKSGTLTATVGIILTVASPASFSVTTSTAALNLPAGSSVAGSITVTPKSGFTGKITLNASGLPTGVTATLNPAVTPGTTAVTTSVITFAATPSAAVGLATVTVTGTSGTAATSVTISLTVKAGFSFTLGASPTTVSVMQGASGTSAVTITPLNGFTGVAGLTVSGLPAGVTASFTPATTATTTSLKLTTSTSAAVGTAALTITATSGTLSAQASLSLTVTAAPGFKLTSSSSNLSIIPGGTGIATITVVPQGGFTGAVALTATGLPTGVTASFSPASTTGTSSLTLAVALSASANGAAFTVTGTSGSLTGAVAITVTVVPPPNFALAVAPGSLRIVQGGKGTAAISLAPLNGFAATVTLSMAGLPAGVTGSLSGLSTGMVLGAFTVSPSAVPSTSTVTVTGTSGAFVHTATLALTIVAPASVTVPVDLSGYYNVSGSAVDTVPFTSGGLDALGRSYSGVLLGASQSIGGTLFSLGPMGLPDAVSGQTVALPAGQFTALKFLATGVNGNQAGLAFTVTYTDGTTGSFTQGVSDWYTPQNYSGEVQAVTTAYRDNSTGTTDGRAFYLYSYSFNLNSAKTVRSITLPGTRNLVVLAVTLTGKVSAAAAVQVDLSKVFNGVGIVSDGKAFTGGLDGVGYAYSGSLLPVSQVLSSGPVQIGLADKPNVVSGSSAAITVPSGKYSSLVVLATGVNGAQLSQLFKVTYSDGTSTTFSQNLSDWFTSNSYAGESIAVAMPYRDTANGSRDNRKFQLYQYTFSLDGNKTVSVISLPANNNVKVFAAQLKP